MTSSPQTTQAALMPAGTRYRIATVSSVGFHAAVVLVVGLLSARTPAAPSTLIPIELTVIEHPRATLALGGGGQPEAPRRESPAPAAAPTFQRRPAASPQGPARSAPAPPRVVTSPRGEEPAGATGAGREAQGPGGQEDQPAGPTYGPGIVGGPLPGYPKDAQDRGLEGRVTLSVAVATDGSITSVEVAESSGHRLLDEAAVRAVRQGWTFTGGMDRGQPAGGKVSLTFEFRQARVTRG